MTEFIKTATEAFDKTSEKMGEDDEKSLLCIAQDGGDVACMFKGHPYSTMCGLLQSIRSNDKLYKAFKAAYIHTLVANIVEADVVRPEK